MFFEFFEKMKTKTLLIAAGFLVPICFAGLVFWLYEYFLVSHDVFFDDAPAESEIYWHSSFPEGADDLWLQTFSKKLLAGQAAKEADFLFKEVGPIASEVSLAALPGHEDFIFWGKIDVLKAEELKGKLETEKFNYIFEDGGKITITNTRFALNEVLSVLSEKSKTLADNKVRLIAWNRANRRLSAQIYFKDNFKFENLNAINWRSDFWEKNILSVGLGPTDNESRSLFDFSWFLITDNRYLYKNAENLIKNNLAVALPEKKERILPDKTVVWEMIANPALFSFSKRTLAGREIDYLSVPELKQDFLIAHDDAANVFVSNSSQKIVDYLVALPARPDYYGKNLVELLSDWLKWMTADFGGVIFAVDVKTP